MGDFVKNDGHDELLNACARKCDKADESLLECKMPKKDCALAKANESNIIKLPEIVVKFLEKLNVVYEKFGKNTCLQKQCAERNDGQCPLKKSACVKVIEKPNFEIILDNLFQFLEVLEIMNNKIKKSNCEQRVPDEFNFDMVLGNLSHFLELITILSEKLENLKCSQNAAGDNFDQVYGKVVKFLDQIKALHETLEKSKCKSEMEKQCQQQSACALKKQPNFEQVLSKVFGFLDKMKAMNEDLNSAICSRKCGCNWSQFVCPNERYPIKLSILEIFIVYCLYV